MKQPSTRSLRGLDAITFLMADVRDGVGPYLSVFLKGDQHWQPGPIGIAVAASSMAAAVFQIPAGLLVDATRARRLLIAGAGLMVGLGCLLIVASSRGERGGGEEPAQERASTTRWPRARLPVRRLVWLVLLVGQMRGPIVV